MKKTKWSKRITVFIFSLMAIFLSLSIFSTNNNYQEIQTQQKNEVSILENAQNSIENSFSRYVNKNEENNGKSLISIYSAIGDQDIKTSNGALAANSSNDFDLLHKLEQLNLDFKDNRLSGVSNDLRIIVNNFDDQDFKDLKFLSILNNLNSLITTKHIYFWNTPKMQNWSFQIQCPFGIDLKYKNQHKFCS
ncbi:MAG: hypothetical protein HRT99_03610 [Mycoplasmatales bacterium]|nr:hypothetical protein [Mycoplasmatales bacterium]